MSDNSQIDLGALKAAVLKEFEIKARELKSNSSSAVKARKAFVLIARAIGYSNAEIATQLLSSRSTKKVSEIFGKASKLKLEDPVFSLEVDRICMNLDITLGT